ncbi:unnamed protein product [Amoebophrya sp. A25]|nr:unnamed protein product [Amoebophrya sp. A25]|eukprot:GSA25T00001791001.1
MMLSSDGVIRIFVSIIALWLPILSFRGNGHSVGDLQKVVSPSGGVCGVSTDGATVNEVGRSSVSAIDESTIENAEETASSLASGYNEENGNFNLQHGCGNPFNWRNAKPYVSKASGLNIKSLADLRAERLADNLTGGNKGIAQEIL